MILQIKEILKFLIPKFLHPYPLFCNYIKLISGRRILAGPFMGVPYTNKSVGSYLMPKILGTYEIELKDTILKIKDKNFDVIINVGAGEGYYVYALNSIFKSSKFIAYEGDSEGRTLLDNIILLQNSKLEVNGFCTKEMLSEKLKAYTKPLIFMDVEGAEVSLLDPSSTKDLLKATIIVEIHDFVDPNISELIDSKFKDTHTIVTVFARRRTIEDFPKRDLLNWLKIFKRYVLWSMEEGRPEGMSWKYLEPRIL